MTLGWERDECLYNLGELTEPTNPDSIEAVGPLMDLRISTDILFQNRNSRTQFEDGKPYFGGASMSELMSA